MPDPREATARYRQKRLAQERCQGEGEAPNGEDALGQDERSAAPTRAMTALDRAAYVDTAIEQAIRRGEFDDLPGAGKPLPAWGASHDPDWWIRRKIETEKLTGLGPPALALRSEYAAMDDQLDELRSEAEVREYLDDFNRRVVAARRQLQGGPPVITPTVDVDTVTQAWRDRRDDAVRAVAEKQQRDLESQRRTFWWERRRSRG